MSSEVVGGAVRDIALYETSDHRDEGDVCSRIYIPFCCGDLTLHHTGPDFWRRHRGNRCRYSRMGWDHSHKRARSGGQIKDANPIGLQSEQGCFISLSVRKKGEIKDLISLPTDSIKASSSVG